VRPSGLRMSFTELPGRLAFTWTSPFPLLDARVILRPVHCGHHPKITVEPQWTWNYKHYSRMWETVYKCVTPELDSKCFYEYEVGAGVLRRSLGQFKVRTAYSYEDIVETEAVSLLVVADLGVDAFAQPTIHSLREAVHTGLFDAILHLGDIAYDLDSTQPGVSRAYFIEMERAISKLPYMVLPGNHEVERDFEQYKVQFRMPKNKANKDSGLFYSFNLGPAHFIALSNEQFLHGPATEGAEQLKWLKRDLLVACANRKSVPWIIVLAHRPFYCNMNFSPHKTLDQFHTNEFCGYDAPRIRKQVEELLYAARVDLVLTGHLHNYQRLQPLYNSAPHLGQWDSLHLHVNPTAPVYIVAGTGGSSEGSDYLSPTPQSWTQVQLRETSYSILHLPNSTHLYWEQVSSLSGQRLDHLCLTKDAQC